MAGKYEFQRLIISGAAAILQMNLVRVGATFEAKKIDAMAEENYLKIASHLYCGPIIEAASIQFGMCSQNFLIQEVI